MGVLINTAYTLQLDGDNNAVRVTDSKVSARDLFLGHSELPKPGGRNPLREAWNGGYAVEIFYFPASSLKITNILRYIYTHLGVYARNSCFNGKLCIVRDHEPRLMGLDDYSSITAFCQ